MIERVSIIGLGLIGGSIAKALKQTKYNLEISAFDKKEILDAAIQDKSIDVGLGGIDEVFSADLIFICLPLDLTLYTLENIAPNLHDGIIVTDVTGVKSPVQKKWDSLNCEGTYIGGHPMTGKEVGGYENSDPLLFENSVYIISETIRKHPEAHPLLLLIQAMGARIKILNPIVHDEIVATVSHLPQLLSVSLLNHAARKESKINFLDFAAGGFRDMTRVASSEFSIWESVIQQNKEKIIASLDNYIEELHSVKNILIKNQLDKLSKKFENARIRRDEVPKNNKGFLSPLFDIYVFVKDEPGVVSKISTTLYKRGINIKDIELLKIREGTGGTFRLSFDSEKDATAAKDLVERLGFKAKY
ncbi:MAG: prephenate dehydrogenase/arogenate dehydrogenase family protein [Chlorobi bacterium]|nr:prephenate dehydrogenase/arogenate dehydrogenase family protein [Chlorobiota bacterium]